MYDFYKVFIKTVLDYLDEGVYFTDINMQILYWNKGAEAITGYTIDEVSMQKCCQVITHTDENGDPLCERNCPITEILTDGIQKETFLFIIHKEGRLIPVTLRTFPVRDKDDKIIGFIELITDNTRQKIGQAKMSALTKAAYIDSLSELFSKQYIENKLQTLLAEPTDTRKSFSILYINITGFRSINEIYGVSRADKLLKIVAKVLVTAIRFPNLVGRWHGASFIAIIDTPNRSLLLLLAEKLKTLISETEFSVGDETVPISVTVGYAISQSYDTLDYIIERATNISPEEKPQELPPTSPTAPVSKNLQKNRFHSAKSKR